jgi:hypothetical protein
MAQEPEHLGIGKVCRWCGVRADTLGSICPNCGRAYDPGGLLERIPFLNWDGPTTRYGVASWALATIAVVAFWIVLLVTHPVAGILVTALGFVVLVAAIGITNALAGRGR